MQKAKVQKVRGSIRRTPGRKNAFTLIEILLAMAIMAVICGTIYEFTATTVRASNVALRLDAQAQAFAGLRRLLEAQFAALPASQQGALFGATEENKESHLDAMQLICPSGNALLSPDAHGLYRVTLRLKEIPKGSGHRTLVMERKSWTDEEEETSPPGSPGAHAELPSDSLRLLPDVRSLEISYFDPRLNGWQDKWMDGSTVPSLVRVRLAMEDSGAPYEFIERIPGGGTPRGLPTLVTGGFVPPNLPANLSQGTNPAAPGTPNFTPPPPPPNFTAPPLPPPGSFPNAPLRMPTGGNASPR